ncbi:MAG: SRPBCC family protein [Phycisphaeraceae bacterium]|nr:SRPBCC family protein [Phycisphaeraceae bacterium]
MFLSPHRLFYRQKVPLYLEEVFSFFSDARNLQKITPPQLRFEIITPMPMRLEAGSIIDYRLRLLGVPFRWRTLIRSWDPPHGFVDEQARGPYRLWQHTHRFRSEGNGTVIEDDLLYRLPLEPLGRLGLPLVRRQLNRIFDYRQQVVAKELAAG